MFTKWTQPCSPHPDQGRGFTRTRVTFLGLLQPAPSQLLTLNWLLAQKICSASFWTSHNWNLRAKTVSCLTYSACYYVCEIHLCCGVWRLHCCVWSIPTAAWNTIAQICPCLFKILPLMNIWVVTSFGLLGLKQLWIFLNVSLHEHIYAFISGMYLAEEFLGPRV